MFCPHLFRAFEDVQVFWRATLNKETPILDSNEVDLTRQLVQTSGAVLCRQGEIICALTLEVLDDEVGESRSMRPMLHYEIDFKLD